VTASWTHKTLGEVLSVQNGYAFDSKAFGAVGFPLIRIRDLKTGVSTETRYSAEFDPKYVVNAGDFLIGMDGEFGCYEWKGEPALLNQRVCRLQGFSEALEPRFLFHGINAHLKAIEEVTGYTTVKHLSSKQILGIEMLVPPRAEQRRIVAILDEAFEGIATAKANAERNLQNARELFTSHLERVFGQRGTDWHEAPLLSFASAISTGPFGSLLHKSDYVSDGVPLVNPINIVDGLIVPDPDKLIDPTTKQRLQSYVLREGDIVVGRRGEIGRCAVVGPTEAGWVCGTGCFFVRPLPTVRSAFIAHLIRSREYRARLERASTGTTMKNLSNTALGELHVAIPPITEQDRALALIGRLAEDCGRLEDVYERKLVALDELKKSLLHQAFTGALTAKSADKQVAEVA